MGTRGQKPKPAHLKVLTGNPGNKKIKAEPKGKVGDLIAPEYFDEQTAKIWDEIIELVPEGILSGTDQPLIEQAALKLSAIRQEGMIDGKLVPGSIPNNWFTEMRQLLSELGMTPSSRARFGGDQHKEKNAFEALG